MSTMMSDELDQLLSQLSAEGLDHPLGRLESDVQRRLAIRRGDARVAGPARFAALALSLVLGTGVGGMTAASAIAGPSVHLFEEADSLAPSTLLEGGLTPFG